MNEEIIKAFEMIRDECKEVPLCRFCSYFDEKTVSCPFCTRNPEDWDIELMRKLINEKRNLN